MGEPEEDTPVLTSEMCKGSCASVIWHLKGWNEHAVFLKDNAACVVEVPVGTSDDGGGDAEGEEPPDPPEEEAKPEESESALPDAPVKLRFFLGHFGQQVGSKWKSWFSLWVSLLSAQKQASFLVEVKEIEESEDPEAEGEEEDAGENEEEDEEDDIEVKAQITIPPDKKSGEEDGEVSALVREQFIPMSWWTTDESGSKSGEEHLTEWGESEELKFKITVTLFQYSGTDNEVKEETEEEQPEQEEEEEEQIPMIRDLKAMYSQEENYADVTLETRDGMILNAHKFVLAARSSYFRGIIEKEVRKKGFTGLIRLANVDGKPMTVVLHWMYTDEIVEEQLGKVMDEVIKVSVKWELKDLLKMLDKKLISVCNTRNMLHLFQVAHKNGLYTAIADISDYIKQNIDSVLPTRRSE